MNERKYYLDNIRWITVCIVVVYHIFYLFNCSGVITNMTVQGVPIVDTFEIFVYPWFMCLLFVVSGISSRLSLGKRTPKEFIKERFSKIFVPSICGIFIYGWIAGYITDKCTDIFAGNGDSVPAVLKYFIYSLIGSGPLWFAHIVFVASLLLLIAVKLDKNDIFRNLCGKTNYLVLFLLTAAVWGSSLILNVPTISVYRFGIYLFMFFLGYFVFSHDEVIEKLKKIAVPMGIIAFIGGIAYTAFIYGKTFTDDSVLQSPITNIYLWTAVLAILGLGAKYLNFSNKFTKYMTKNNFAFYVLHYTIVLLIGYFCVTYLNLPFGFYYVIMAVGTVIILPVLTEIIKRIPVLRKLVLGISKPKKKKSTE